PRLFFFTSRLQPPKSPLFPYTTLFRSATISISPSLASVPVGDIQQFTTTTDPTGSISWSLEITYYTGCPQHCVSHRSTCSGCGTDRKSTRLNSSHVAISYAVFCLKKKN